MLAGRPAPRPVAAYVAAADAAFAEGRRDTFITWPSGREVVRGPADERLSQAVVVYVRGRTGQSPPTRDAREVVNAFGNAAPRLLKRVGTVFDRLDVIAAAELPRLPGDTASTAGIIRARLAAEFPQLDDRALDAAADDWSRRHETAGASLMLTR